MTRRQEYTVGERASSINSVGKTGQMHAKKTPLDYFPIPHAKVNSKQIKDLNFLEENTGSLSNMFLDLPTQATETKTKIDKWDHIKLKSFCTEKETTNKVYLQMMYLRS